MLSNFTEKGADEGELTEEDRRNRAGQLGLPPNTHGIRLSVH